MSRRSESSRGDRVRQQLGSAVRPERPPGDRGEIDSELVRRPEPASTPLGPVRTCVGCRARASADDLLRVVVVAGAVVPDPRRGFTGRGAWLHRSMECLRLAERRKAFPRALRVPGPLAVEALVEHLEQVAGEHDIAGPTGDGQGTRKQVDPS